MNVRSLLGALVVSAVAAAPVELDSRRELFVDRLLIEQLEGTSLRLHEPVPGGVAVEIDQPWEGPANGPLAVLRHGDPFLLYYRAMTVGQDDETGKELPPCTHLGQAVGCSPSHSGFRASVCFNYRTSAAGSRRVEIQSAQGNPIPGFAAADGIEIIGDEIEREVLWRRSADVSRLAGQSVRPLFSMKDADLYALRFGPDPKHAR